MQRVGAYAGMAAIALDVFTVAVLTLIDAGHDAVHGYISTFGVRGNPVAPWYVAAGSFATLLHLTFMVGLIPTIRGRPGWWAPSTALTIFFVNQWLAATFFPCDPGCEWNTVRGTIHYGVALSGFVALGVGILTFSTTVRMDWPAAKATHVLAGITIALALVLLVADQVGRYHGIAERAALLAFGAWHVAVAWSLRRLAD